MPTFVEYLEEVAAAGATISIRADELDRLQARFGDRVRHMGRWNASSDGALEIPMGVISEAVSRLNGPALRKAIEELKTGPFTGLLNAPHASALIDSLVEAYRVYFRQLMARYRSAADGDESALLRDQLVEEVFGR